MNANRTNSFATTLAARRHATRAPCRLVHCGIQPLYRHALARWRCLEAPLATYRGQNPIQPPSH